MRQVENKVVELPIEELKPYDNNAKKHTNEQLDAVEASIKEFGFRNPIIAWHDETGAAQIVAGHARATVAKKLGYQTVPVIFADDLEDDQRRALTLVDNQTTMMTGWDADLLAYELDVLADSFDMADLGFSGVEMGDIDELFKEHEEEAQEATHEPKMVTCPHCGESFEA